MTKELEKNVQTIIPAVDIVETKNGYTVTLDIPGAQKDRIKAQVEENTLKVTASVEQGNETEEAREYRREFSLANDVDLNSVEAAYDLGVLTITLKKKIQYLPKEITIQ
jgi:HSP20 family protein